MIRLISPFKRFSLMSLWKWQWQNTLNTCNFRNITHKVTSYLLRFNPFRGRSLWEGGWSFVTSSKAIQCNQWVYFTSNFNYFVQNSVLRFETILEICQYIRFLGMQCSCRYFLVCKKQCTNDISMIWNSLGPARKRHLLFSNFRPPPLVWLGSFCLPPFLPSYSDSKCARSTKTNVIKVTKTDSQCNADLLLVYYTQFWQPLLLFLIKSYCFTNILLENCIRVSSITTPTPVLELIFRITCFSLAITVH